jgi:hypothetical protein
MQGEFGKVHKPMLSSLEKARMLKFLLYFF